MKKSSLTNKSKSAREGLPKILALEKCVKTFSIKVQPSLFNILKKTKPTEVRRILIDNLKEAKD